MKWKFEDGIAQAPIYPTGPKGEPWCPASNPKEQFDALPSWSPTIDQVLRIDGVNEVDSCGAQGFHVIIQADSVAELPAAVEHVKTQLQCLFVQSYEQRTRKATA